MCKGNALVLPFNFGRVLKIYDDSRMRKLSLFGDELKTIKLFLVSSTSHLLSTCKRILE